MDWTDYASEPKDKLLLRLGEISQELAKIYDQLYHLKCEELRLKAEGWSTSQGSSERAKDRDADTRALQATLSRISFEGKQKVLAEEKFYLIHLLEKQ